MEEGHGNRDVLIELAVEDRFVEYRRTYTYKKTD